MVPQDPAAKTYVFRRTQDEHVQRALAAVAQREEEEHARKEQVRECCGAGGSQRARGLARARMPFALCETSDMPGSWAPAPQRSPNRCNIPHTHTRPCVCAQEARERAEQELQAKLAAAAAARAAARGSDDESSGASSDEAPQDGSSGEEDDNGTNSEGGGRQRRVRKGQPSISFAARAEASEGESPARTYKGQVRAFALKLGERRKKESMTARLGAAPALLNDMRVKLATVTHTAACR